MKTPKEQQPDIFRRLALRVRRERTKRWLRKIHDVEAHFERLIDFHAALIRDSRAAATGAVAALAQPLSDGEGALLNWLSACEAVVGRLWKNRPSSELREAIDFAGRARERFLLMNMALEEAVLSWRLRTQQWLPDWPVNSRGAAIPLPPSADDESEWLMGCERRERLIATENLLASLKQVRRRYVRVLRDLTSYCGPDNTTSRQLSSDVVAHICALKRAADAAFAVLVALRNPDVPDQAALASALPSLSESVLAVIEACAPIDRQIENWKTAHPEFRVLDNDRA